VRSFIINDEVSFNKTETAISYMLSTLILTQTFQPSVFHLLCYLDKLNVCTMMVNPPVLEVPKSDSLNTKFILN